MTRLRNLAPQLARVQEIYSDQDMASEHRAYQYMLEFYSMEQPHCAAKCAGAPTPPSTN